MTAKIENDSKEPLIGDISFPNERQHLFGTLQALCDFTVVFQLKNFNVRYGQLPDGKYVYQLIYQPKNE